MARPPPRTLGLAAGLVLFLLFFLVRNGTPTLPSIGTSPLSTSGDDPIHTPTEAKSGDVIMDPLRNETLKAELGRAAWKLFHTTMAHFPEKPSEDESSALKKYIHLFARLYPCGECASHFQQILKKWPPQASSRSAAAAWGCHVHNEVNKSKGKPIFDCANIGGLYDCGCGSDEEDKADEPAATPDPAETEKAKIEPGALDHSEPVEIVKEGPTNGG
jgi:FAD-linked sulfhydryl oxidase